MRCTIMLSIISRRRLFWTVVVCLQLLFQLQEELVTAAFDPPSVFPASTRQALAEKARQLTSSSTGFKQQYSPSGWSNRAGTVLTPQYLDPGIYTADRPFYWNNIDVGCRCTVIELPSSSGGKPDLWVHSPVGLDGPLQKALSELGHVKYVVSPNYEHVKFAPQWAEAYPECQMFACPGLAERMPQVAWAGEIPTGFRPKGWKGGQGTENTITGLWDTDIIQPLHIDIELNPFTGKPFFNEVIYYHTPSKTLILTDLFWNYPRDGVPNSQYGANDSWELAPLVDKVPLGSRLWKFGMDKVYAPFFDNFMVQDKSEYRAIANHIVKEWNVEMVVPAHGDIIRGKDFIRNILTKHFQL